MNKTPNQRGTAFQDRIEALLAGLRDKHPGTVEYEPQYPLTLRTGRVVRPDFMLRVKEPDAIHEHLIECQSRDTASHAVTDKIQMIRNNSDRNRFYFVHEEPISDAVLEEMGKHGITVFPYEEFVAFIAAKHKKLSDIAASQNIAMQSVRCSPPVAQQVAPVVAFQPRTEKSFGNSRGIGNKGGFGNNARGGSRNHR